MDYKQKYLKYKNKYLELKGSGKWVENASGEEKYLLENMQCYEHNDIVREEDLILIINNI